MAAFHWQDNLSSTAFTPRDFQVELLAAASEQNIIICLGHNSSKEFISLKLILEKGHELRCRKGNENKKVTIILTNGGESMYNLIYHLTDLKVINANTKSDDEFNWQQYFQEFQVIILSVTKCSNAFIMGAMDFSLINLIIIEDCHKNYDDNKLVRLIEYARISKPGPKILGLAGPLHSAGCSTDQLGFHLEVLEKTIQCKAETASDIVTVLRYCAIPTEYIVQCLPPRSCEVSATLRDLILTKKHFLLEHRFDPYEIYSDEFEDELKSIPDPKKEPVECLDHFLSVLDEFGPWCADRAALNLIGQIEKSKIKTPYERHYLLLCMVSTTLVQIRAYCEHIFQSFQSDKECIEMYTSPKALRLLDILRQFKPEKSTEEQKDTKKHSSDSTQKCSPLEELNKKPKQSVSTIDESNLLKDQDQSHENKHKQITEKTDDKCNVENKEVTKPASKTNIIKRTKGGFTRPPRQFNHNQNDPNALCGLLLCSSVGSAKILFSFIYEMTKHDPDLEYLSVQYTGDRVADPVTETKKFENEHRKQEEVLKRFRMHSCNLLIGTSVLEEGIELPKCNLVVRWNLPTTYRSYVQCKGRARAQRAFHVIMVAASEMYNIPSGEFISTQNHKSFCSNEKEQCFDTTVLQESLGKDVDSSADEDENTNQLLSIKNVEAMENETENIVKLMAQYMQIERILLRKCSNQEPSLIELMEADLFTNFIKPYKPIQSDDPNTPFVSLATAVVLVNKYCAKLPSDTFTKLTPLWRCCKTYRQNIIFYQYTVRLPINSPVKQDIYGLPMPSKVLARRLAALICCKVLHKSGELDNNLQPIGKEGFRASEPDWNNFELEKEDADIVNENLDPRPGTTRRRQYYYKRIASVLSSCRPSVGIACKLYFIKMVLECPIPEEQNTRGRKIYAPEDAVQGFGLLTLKHIPKLGSFSIFTRSGEVRVSLELASDHIVIAEEKLPKINVFLKYLFANVLRLQRYLMFFDASATENSFFVVPTIKDENDAVNVDWSFLELIADKCDQMPQEVPETIRATQDFDREKFRDAVVMPWYRNQDQPQYFYVAEICDYLSPESSFPGDCYATFKEYYFRKYNITIQNRKQPLLDVDHTSARLNFLTPRYVNRKGVALPTSSEETKRAKRENLEQKQILVPELCTIHPFPASLWRIAVCLPCVLYRINALLLADEIRIEVADEINLGRATVRANFDWPVLDFGWKLADVLRRARDSKNKEIKKSIEMPETKSESISEMTIEDEDEEKPKPVDEEAPTDSKYSPDASDPNMELLKDVEKKLEDECLMEIGTWSNTMAENIEINENSSDDEWNGILPSNISICSRNNLNVRYGSPTSWDVRKTKTTLKTIGSESDLSSSDQSDDDFFYHSEGSTDDNNEGLNIEFKSDNLAEAIETEEEILKRQRKIEIINDINANEKSYQSTKNIGSGYNCAINQADLQVCTELQLHEEQFRRSVHEFERTIQTSGTLINHSEPIKIPEKSSNCIVQNNGTDFKHLKVLFSFIDPNILQQFIEEHKCIDDNGEIRLSIDDVYDLHKIYFNEHSNEQYSADGVGSMFDAFNDRNCMQIDNDGTITYNLKSDEFLKDRTITREKITEATEICKNIPDELEHDSSFSFDRQPNLNDHPGPSPSIILQALTMSNANDGINLERLETIGDSFLKYAITTYLYCTYENVHEGKLSHLRSRQVSNLNLYRLGRRKMLGERMIATKFEPHDNWLPPCYYVPKDLEKALIDARIPACYWEDTRLLDVKELSVDEICQRLKKRILTDDDDYEKSSQVCTQNEADSGDMGNDDDDNDESNEQATVNRDDFPCFIPYNLVTQHSIPDKSIADCVEALIGANLIECGPRGALLFMAWLGIRVLPWKEEIYDEKNPKCIPGSTKPFERDGVKYQNVYGYWAAPKSPLLHFAPNPYETLELILDGYSDFEAHIGYYFNDRSYLLQAMTHASYSQNRLTDCYQRLEFLGDAVLDYLITRHLYEDPRQHSPGALTDLRSALVNNTIFASLAVRHGFHKYFRHLSPGLNDVIDRFVRIQVENDHSISEEFYLISEEECDEAEDVEVPKALGDIFESVAGAIFLDSNMSLDMVWKIYSNMMKPEIELFSNSVPKSPIRELLELEPETAKFGKPEKLADGRRVRVSVDVFGKGTFRGIGRNYRIAKCTAAKCALRQLKKQGLINRKRID